MLAMANGMMPLAPVGGASLGRPYGAKHLAGKLARGTAAELQTMIQMLNLRAAEIAMEMQTLQDLDKDGLGALQLEPPVLCACSDRCMLTHLSFCAHCFHGVKRCQVDKGLQLDLASIGICCNGTPAVVPLTQECACRVAGAAAVAPEGSGVPGESGACAAGGAQ